MRRWLWYSVLTAGVGLGLVTLVWAATFSRGTSVQYNPADVATIPTLISDLTNLRQLGGNPAAPAATTWNVYTTAAGLFVQNSAGVAVGPLGPTGTAPAIVTVRTLQTLSATGNPAAVIQHASDLTVIEFLPIASAGGALTNNQNPRIAPGVQGQIVIVQGTSASNTYAIPDGNGVKFADGNAVLFTDRMSMSLRYDTSLGSWRELARAGGGVGGGGGNASSVTFAPTGGLAATTVQTAVAELDSEAEKLANKNVPSGYLGLNTTGDATWDRVESYATHPALSVSSAIDANTLQVRTIGIENFGTGNLLLNGVGVNPRITGCTTATGGTGRNGTRLVLRGTHATKTVTIPTGNGVKLAGNIGSVIVGANLSPVEFECNETDQLWVQMTVPSAQQAFNVGRTVAIYACGNALNPLLDGGGGTTLEFCLDGTGAPGWKAQVAGADTDSVIQLSAGKDFFVKKHDGATLFNIDNDTGTITGLGAGTTPMMQGSDNGSTTCSSGGDTWYLQPMGRLARTGGAGEIETDAIIPGTYSFKNLQYLSRDVLGAGQTLVVTVRKNGVSTGLFCGIIAGAGVGTGEVGTTTDKRCQDVNPAHAVSVVPGDVVNLQVFCSGGTVGLGFISFAMQYQ